MIIQATVRTYVKLLYVIQPKYKHLQKSPNKSHHWFAIKMIQDLGVKKYFFEVLAKSVSYESTPYWLWPCNLIHVPVCQLAEDQSQKRQLYSFVQFLWHAVFFLISFYFLLLMLGFWQGARFKNLTAWLGVTHGSRASSGCSAYLMVVWSWPFLKTNQNKCLLFWVW